MKKVLSAFFVLFLALGTSFAAPKKSIELEPIEIDSIIQTDEYGTLYEIYPPLEVVGIICRLAGYKLFQGYYTGEDSYTTQIDTLYKNKKDHKAVQKAINFASRGIESDAMVTLAYYIKPDFSGTITNLNPLPENLKLKWKKIKPKEIESFVKMVHDFAQDTNYQRIFLLNRATLLSNIGYFNNDYNKYAFIKWSKDFFGETDYKNNVISVNMICPCYFFIDSVSNSDNEKTLYSSIYPGCGFLNAFLCTTSALCLDVSSEIWEDIKDHYRALSCYMIKKQSPDNFKEIEKNYTPTYNEVADFMSFFCFLNYLKDSDYLETIKDEDYPYTYESLFSGIEKTLDGFFVYDAVKLLDEYSNNRDKYPTFKDFAPKIAEFINSIQWEEEN